MSDKAEVKNIKSQNENEKFQVDLLDSFNKSIDDEMFRMFSNYNTTPENTYTSSNYTAPEINIDELIEAYKEIDNEPEIREICFTGEIENPVKILDKYLCLPRKDKSTYFKIFNTYDKDTIGISFYGIPVYDDDEIYYGYIYESLKDDV
jgi:hypothetical protein